MSYYGEEKDIEGSKALERYIADSEVGRDMIAGTSGVYELVSSLSKLDVAYIFKKLDWNWYYGAPVQEEVFNALREFCNKYDAIHEPAIPETEEEASSLDKEEEDDALDRYFAIESFAEDVQTIVDEEFKDYRR